MKPLALSALLMLSPIAAYAQSQNCAPRDTVVSRYGESRQAIGLGGNNQVVEIFASEETGTWTITVTTASGVTCLVASGQAYERLTEVTGDPA